MSRMVRAAGAAACPFCGGEEVYVEEYEHHPGAVRWRVFCAGCMAGIDTGTRQSAGAAVQDWNRRAGRTCQIVVSIDRSPASYGGRVHRCSSCGKALPGALFRNGWVQLDYCPRCGARVTEVIRDAD